MFSSDKKLGIVGGGQLGKMMLYKTRQWDIYTKVLDPSKEAPSRMACNEFVQGSLTDYDTVYNFGEDCDYLTIEIENVNTDALQKLEDEGKIVHPKPSVIKLIQDKGLQKEFYQNNKFMTSPFALYASREDILQALNTGKITFPFVQKSRLAGYDGKGVAVIKTEGDIDSIMDVPSVIEDMVAIKQEIAVIAARNSQGEVKSYAPVVMEFNEEANLLDLLLFPADMDTYIADKAKKMAEDLIEKLDMCGLLAVEFFIAENDDVIINEVAPRPHNSGHQTIESCNVNQYEQHLRCVFNFPLGETTVHTKSAMINILGDKGHTGPVEYTGLDACMQKEGLHIHIYGKKETKPFRKMGHITVTNTNLEQAKTIALWAKKQIQVKSLQLQS